MGRTETDTTRRVLVGARLPAALARRLKVEAARRGSSVQAIIEKAVREHLATKRTTPRAPRGG